MIQSVRILNDRGIDREFFINQVNSGVVVRNITGLGPVQATINTEKPTGLPGVIYNSQEIGERNIVLNFDLRGTAGLTASQIRRSLYKTFPVGQLIRLRFKEDGDIWTTEGRVEISDPVHFSKDPAHMVSIICENPYFKKYTASNNPFTFTVPSDGSWISVPYVGEVDQGLRFEIQIAAEATTENLMTSHRIEASTSGYSAESFYIDDFDILGITGSRFRQGDKLTVSTVRRNRYAKILKASDSKEYNVIGSLKSGSGGYFIRSEHWPMLRADKTTRFRWLSTAYDPSLVTIKAYYDVAIEGL